MSATAEAIVHDAVRRLAVDPRRWAIYAEFLDRMRRGRFSAGRWRGWLDVVVQPEPGAEVDMCDAWAFAQVHCMRCLGKLAVASVAVGAPPAPGGSVVHDTAALAALPEGFHAVLQDGSDEAQGFLEWTRSITASVEVREGNRTWVRQLDLEPGCAPLVVGEVRAWQTWFLLNRRRSVARWPRGERFVTLLVNRDSLWLPHELD